MVFLGKWALVSYYGLELPRLALFDVLIKMIQYLLVRHQFLMSVITHGDEELGGGRVLELLVIGLIDEFEDLCTYTRSVLLV